MAIFSVPEPSNWMGGETADPLVLSVYSGAGCWRFDFAFFGSLGIVKQACFVSLAPRTSKPHPAKAIQPQRRDIGA